MKPRHILMLIFTAAIWGFNFVPIRIALNHIPPMTFTAMRFLLTVLPAIFFVKKPDLPTRKLIAYGLLMYAFQFSLMFSAIYAGLSAGLAALVMQVQAFFTIALAGLIMKEKPLAHQVAGAVIAIGGIAVVALHTGGDVTMAGLALAMVAAFSWSCGNVMTKSFGKIDMFPLIIWGNLAASVPLVVLAFAVDGTESIRHSIAELHGVTLLALAYIVYLSTFVGYTLWSRKLALYSAADVAPFALLVPVFAMLGSALTLGEAYPMWKFWATMLILGGLGINQFGGQAMVAASAALKKN